MTEQNFYLCAVEAGGCGVVVVLDKGEEKDGCPECEVKGALSEFDPNE
jgi:hypothetical protein